MSVVLHELRKIFEWKRVLLTIIACILIFFNGSNLRFLDLSGYSWVASYQVATEIMEEFGLGLNREELMIFQKETDSKIDHFYQLLETNEEFQALGISSFALMSKYINHELRWLSTEEIILYEEYIRLVYEIEEREALIGRYDNFVNWGKLATYQRQREVASRMEHSILPWQVLNNFRNLSYDIGIMLVLSLVIMISPIYLVERRSRMIALQYTTRVGRRLFQKKLIAIILAAIIITSIQLGVMFLIYRQQGTLVFFSLDINSIHLGVDSISWYDITYGQYVALVVSLFYLIGILTALLISLISRISQNFLTAFGTQIPIFIFFLSHLFVYLIMDPISISHPRHFVPSLYMGLILLVSGLTICHWKREKKLDLKD